MTRVKIVPIRFTEEEYDQLIREADMKGFKTSTLIRSKLYEFNILKKENNNEKKD